MVLATATDLSALSRVHTIEEKWSLLKTIIHLLTEAVVLLRQQRRHGQSRPWMTERVREQYKLRDATWKAYIEAKMDASFEVYRNQRNKAGHMQRKAGMAYETNLATSAAVNPTKLFGHIQQNKRLKNQIVTLKNADSLRVTILSFQPNQCLQ